MCMVCGLVMVVLLAIAAGYIVLLKADKADGSLKMVGKIIGWVIIVVATVTLIWSVSMSICCSRKGYCRHGMYGSKSMMYNKMGMKKHIKGKMGMMDEDCPYIKYHLKKMNEEKEEKK